MKIVSYNYNNMLFSFYNVFYYTRPSVFCHFLRDFVSFTTILLLFYFFFRKTLIPFRSVFWFFVFLCYLDNIQLDYICEKSFIRKLIKKFDLKMLKQFYKLLNFNFIMIFIIHKISVLLKITQITLNVIFSNTF